MLNSFPPATITEQAFPSWKEENLNKLCYISSPTKAARHLRSAQNLNNKTKKDLQCNASGPTLPWWHPGLSSSPQSFGIASSNGINRTSILGPRGTSIINTDTWLRTRCPRKNIPHKKKKKNQFTGKPIWNKIEIPTTQCLNFYCKKFETMERFQLNNTRFRKYDFFPTSV